jgi:hypothetical protein
MTHGGDDLAAAGIHAFADIATTGLVLNYLSSSDNDSNNKYVKKLRNFNKKLRKINNPSTVISNQISVNNKVLVEVQDCKGIFESNSCIDRHRRNIIDAVDDSEKLLNKHGIRTDTFYQRYKIIIIYIIAILIVLFIIYIIYKKLNTSGFRAGL